MPAPDLVGKQTALVPMRQEEVGLLVDWLSAPELQAVWLGHAPSRSEVLDRWPPQLWDDAYPMKGRCFRIELQRAPVGMAAYREVTGKPRSARMDLVLAPGVLAEVGADALVPLARFLFEGLHASEAWALLPAADARTLAAFEASGFGRAPSPEPGSVLLRLHRPAPRRTRAADTKPK